MGAIGCDCCCTASGCETIAFTVPDGVRSSSFSIAGNTHPLSSSPSFSFAKSSVLPCCSSASVTVNQIVTGATFTNSFDVTDLADTEGYYCCGTTAQLVDTRTTDVRKSTRSAYRVDMRYCTLSVSVCAAQQTVAGVPTCGLLVTVSLGFNSTTASQVNFVSEGKMVQSVTGNNFCVTGYEAPYTQTIWKACADVTITAWSAAPTMPTLSITVPNCGDVAACTMSRSKFLPGVTSIPPGTIIDFPSAVASTSGTCGGVVVFSPCTVQTGYWIPDVLDACGIPGFFNDHNFGRVCAGEPGAFCTTDIGVARKLISRTRTQTQTTSHASGTKIFDPYLGAWSLTL